MRRALGWGLVFILSVIVIALVVVELRQLKGNQRAQVIIDEFKAQPIAHLGSVNKLTILPLVDYHTAHEPLKTEVGVSYLVEVDSYRILFDVARNTDAESPSPLEYNMAALGIKQSSIDLVFISHNHFDHVGGLNWELANSFSLGNQQKPFTKPQARLVVPEPMTYPGLKAEVFVRPEKLLNGVATTGTIPRQLVIGWLEEHSLVVNVEGLGGVIIVGCGHQSLPNLLQRYDDVFEQPLYGIVGGLHLPVPQGRMNLGPVNGQRRFASGDSVLNPLSMSDVEQQLALLKRRSLGVIGIGGHDSSDQVIALAKSEFGSSYREVRVGERIVIEAPAVLNTTP